MAPQPQPTKPKRLIGVLLIALLFYTAGAFLLFASALAGQMALAAAPWRLYFLGAIYFIVLGWGMWGAKRWAYFAALLMCAVSAYYLIMSALQLNQFVLVPFTLIALLAGYLVQPRVRAAFLRKD
ncbi:MAG: hypothetical protein MI924_36600 [Chloroflexales bacterium]|nr:hypothetical protein [Chloroflexales bacterium]